MRFPIKQRFATVLGAVTLLTSGVASASLMNAIDALNSGDMYRVLFVTSTDRDAFSTNIADYNQFVTDAAAGGAITAPLGLSWRALASTATTNAQDNTGIFNNDNTQVFFFNTNGDRLALSGADLWDGQLAAPVLYNEDGSPRPFVEVWTGTTEFGVTADPLGAGFFGDATFGSSSTSGPQWMNEASATVENVVAMYGVSAKVTVPSIGVPEPTTATLLGLALLVGVTTRRRKRTADA